MDQEMSLNAEIVHAVTEPTRFKMLCMLMQHHYCVRAVAKKLGISEPAVSQHINLLKKYGVVYGIKRGYQMHYQVNIARLREAFGAAAGALGLDRENDSAELSCECEFAGDCAHVKH